MHTNYPFNFRLIKQSTYFSILTPYAPVRVSVSAFRIPLFAFGLFSLFTGFRNQKRKEASSTLTKRLTFDQVRSLAGVYCRRLVIVPYLNTYTGSHL